MLKEKYINKTKETSINVNQTKIDSIKRTNIEKTSLRIYKNGYIGYAGAIGDYNEKTLKNRALESLNNKISYNYEIEGNKSMEEDLSTEIINENKLVEEFEELLSTLKKEQPEFFFSNKIYLIENETKIINDNNLSLYYKDKILSLLLLFKEKKSINVFDGYIQLIGREYNSNLILEYINNTCNAYKNQVKLPTKEKLPIVFPSSDMGPFIKFIKDLDGNNFGSGSSLFSNKKGQKIFDDNFTLYQNNNPKETFVPFFDKEGVVNKNYKYPLINKGVLNSPYTDKRTSNKYSLPLTGAASGEYDGIPKLGFPRLSIKESEKTAKELLGGEMGIFIIVAQGGDFTTDGSFATPVQLSLLFDGEKFVGRLPEINISSNVFDMFGSSFRGVSKDTLSPISNDKFLIMDMKVNKL